MNLHLYPDARPWSVADDTVHLGVADMPAALHALRCLWSDHRDIVTLPSLRILWDDGVTAHQRMQIEDRLAGFIFDLGNSAEDAWWGARNAMRNSVLAVDAPKQDALVRYAAGRSVVCVASGPSVARHLDEIRAAQRAGAVIVCADSIYRTLVEHQIEPDFVCVLERQPVFAALVPSSICERTRLVCPPVVDASTVAGWYGRTVWFWQTVPDLYAWLGEDVPTAYSGRSAGTLAVAVARLLGGVEIHLVGHDLCKIDKATHAPTVGALTRDGQAKAEAESAPCGMFAPQEVACRDGQIRASTRFWGLCRQDIETMLVGCTVPVYGVDAAGAHIHGATPAATLRVSPSGTSPRQLGFTIPSRYRMHLAGDMRSDILRALTRINSLPDNPTPSEALELSASLEPKAWAHRDTVRLFWHVLSPIYHAASLRAHLRRSEAEWPILALRVLQRGLPPILDQMDRDLRGMQPC